MATTTIEPQQLDEKYHFLLRKLHSLTGIVPLGVFLCEHMLTNSMAYGPGGPEAFDKSVHFLHELPHLWALEVFGIFLPLAFHAIYGIAIALSGKSNVSTYTYCSNWRYLFQRVTGFAAFAFLIVHLLKFRFAHLINWGPEFVGSANPFELTRNGLMAWTPGGDWSVAPWLTFAIYWIGLAAACFHFANGIWAFCITWGITIGEKSQKRAGVVAAMIGILLFVGGGLSLFGFRSPPEEAHSPSEPVLVEHGSQQAMAEVPQQGAP